MTLKEADELEITLISNLKTQNRNKGYNFSSGGEKIARGYIRTQEHKAKVSAS